MFDLSKVETSNSFETLPEGKYVANVTNAEIKETKNGTGKYIRTELTIAAGENKGRKIWTNFNVENQNQMAVEIGLKQLKTMLQAANAQSVDKLASVSDLCGLTVGVKTKIKTDEYGEKAEVHYFFSPKDAKETAASSDTIPF
jgi:hypothetical protein